MKPEKSAFTRKEWKIIESHRTPLQVQKYLRSLVYNKEEEGDSQRSFRTVVSKGSAHCLEAALTAAAILEQHGYPPRLISFESIDHLDHVIYVYQKNGLWGSIARSRDEGLHGRKPVFKTARALAASYIDPYVDFSGRITGFKVVELSELGNYDWRFSKRNLWKLEKYLLAIRHDSLSTPEARYQRLLKRYKEFRKKHPEQQATYFRNTHLWT